MSNIIHVSFGARHEMKTEHRWQGDYGQVLVFDDIELPLAYEVHFSNNPEDGEGIGRIGNADGVTIPNELFSDGRDIYAWIFLHDSENDGRTMYRAQIPVRARVARVDEEPTPEEQSEIDQAIAALNAAVDAAEAARDAAQAAAGDFQGITADAETTDPDTGATIEVTHSEGGLYHFAFGIPKGKKGDQGEQGPAPTDAQVATATDAWLEENITNPSSPPLDTSLSLANAAAPANLVGNKDTIAPTETSPAESAHAVGEFLIYNGALYEVTAAIAVGDTLTVGTNIAAAPAGLSGEVTELKSAIGVLEPSATSSDVGKALIAKTVSGGKVTEYKFGEAGGGVSTAIRDALLACFAKVAWIDEDGQDYYDALEAALYPQAGLDYIEAVYTQTGTVYNTDSLDSLKSDLVVTAYYDDGTSETVTNYTLSGTLSTGTSTITVTYGGKTDTFDVIVTANNVITLTSSTSDNQYKNDTTITGVIIDASSDINISGHSFNGCTSLTFVHAKSSCKCYAYAFANCTALTTVTFDVAPGSLVASTFSNCNNLTDIYIAAAEGAIANAPWGAPNTTRIHYNYVPS